MNKDIGLIYHLKNPYITELNGSGLSMNNV
jgi:hypothetical protein